MCSSIQSDPDYLEDLIHTLQINHTQIASDNIGASRSNNYNDYLYWLYEDNNTPFYDHIAALRLGKTILAEDAPRPNIIWDSNNQFEGLTCNGEHFSLAKLRKLVADLSNLATDIMVKKLLFGRPMPDLLDPENPMQTNFMEKMQNTKFGYSFLNDRSNPSLTREETRAYILNILCNDLDLSVKFLGDGTSENKVAFGSWMKDAGEFVKIMTILIHLTSGQPSRGTELLESSSICNTESGPRSLYWVHNTVMFVQSYNKSRSRTGKDMMIARFLPKYLLPMFLTYLVCVRPMEK